MKRCRTECAPSSAWQTLEPVTPWLGRWSAKGLWSAKLSKEDSCSFPAGSPPDQLFHQTSWTCHQLGVGAVRFQVVTEAPYNSTRAEPEAVGGQGTSCLSTQRGPGPAPGAALDSPTAEKSARFVNLAEQCKEIHNLQEAERDVMPVSLCSNSCPDPTTHIFTFWCNYYLETYTGNAQNSSKTLLFVWILVLYQKKYYTKNIFLLYLYSFWKTVSCWLGYKRAEETKTTWTEKTSNGHCDL